MHEELQTELQDIRTRMTRAAEAAGRDARDITLVGASKTQPPEILQQAWLLGLQDFGENYLAEAIPKIESLARFTGKRSQPAPTWHYIGRIQSNKTRLIATHFDWIHTVDRPKIAERLSAHCPPGKTLNILVQVNIDADPAKAGVQQADTWPLVELINQLPNLRARGLMTILSKNPEAGSGAGYQSMAQLSRAIGARLETQAAANWGTLSMGMSGDLDTAIAQGATQVRIGTALFGVRPKPAA